MKPRSGRCTSGGSPEACSLVSRNERHDSSPRCATSSGEIIHHTRRREQRFVVSYNRTVSMFRLSAPKAFHRPLSCLHTFITSSPRCVFFFYIVRCGHILFEPQNQTLFIIEVDIRLENSNAQDRRRSTVFDVKVRSSGGRARCQCVSHCQAQAVGFPSAAGSW